MTGPELADRRRIAIAVACIFSVFGAHVLSTASLLSPAGAVEPACWVIANGFVLKPPGNGDCPLRTNDRVVEIAGKSVTAHSQPLSAQLLASETEVVPVAVRRGGELLRKELRLRFVSAQVVEFQAVGAFLLSMLFLAIPIALLVRSRAPAAEPLTLLYGAMGVLLAVSSSRGASPVAAGAALVAVALIPGAVGQLGLVFPRKRNLIATFPGLIWLPYSMTAIALAYGWLVLSGSPLLWPAFVYLVLAMTLAGWGLLATSCFFAIRESESAVERARSRFFVAGFVVVPGLAALAFGDESLGFADWLISFVWFSAVALPILIAIAISEYSLFNFSWDGRRLAAQLLQFAASAGVAFGVLVALSALSAQPHSPSLLSILPIAFGLTLAAEIARRFVARSESWIAPEAAHLRQARLKLVDDMTRVRDEDGAFDILMEAARDGVSAASGAIFLAMGPGWRLARTFGELSFSSAQHAREGVMLLGERAHRHLAKWPVEEDLPELAREGVEGVFGLRNGGNLIGLLLLGRRGRSPYADPQLEFVALACDRAGSALRTLQLTEDFVEREKQAATGRMAVVLAHDLGKELSWLSQIAKRLPDRLQDERRLVRDAEMIRELSEALVPAVRGFVRDSREYVQVLDGPTTADDVIDSAVRRMNRIHGADRISESVDPATRNVRIDRSLRRVLANLLDNALLATPGDDPVQLYATYEEGHVRIQVEDRGPGIPGELAQRVFEPGFSTRREEGGLGVGLTVAREMATELGGELILESRDGGGTRAILRIPADPPEAYSQAAGG